MATVVALDTGKLGLEPRELLDAGEEAKLPLPEDVEPHVLGFGWNPRKKITHMQSNNSTILFFVFFVPYHFDVG